MAEKFKILIIEDDINTRIYLCNLLCAEGFDPVSALNRKDGIYKARTERPALIVLDGMLPGKESIDIYYQLKSDSDLRHIPVVILASINRHTFCYYQKSQRLQRPDKVPDPDAFLTKPPEAEEFLTLVTTLVNPPPADHQRKAP